MDEYNISNTSFINTLWIVREPDYIIIRVAIFLPLVLLGIFGNSLIIYIIWKNPHIKTPTHLLIGNMAFADLLSLLFHPWIFLTYDIYQNYQLGSIGCKFEGSLECAILLTSVISMSIVTYDRLTAIVLPKETRLSKRSAKIIMALTWAIGFALSTPLVFCRHYKERQWKDFLEKYCNEDTMIINIYWYVIITVLIWIPLSIQIICYISIFIKLNRYEKSITLKLHKVSYKKQAAKMMFVVILTFMICHLPFTALIMYRHQLLKDNGIETINPVNYKNQVDGAYHSLWFTSKYLILLNGAVNPIIYGLTNEKFRRALQRTLIVKIFFIQPKQSSITAKPPRKKEKVIDTSKNKIFLICKRKVNEDKICTLHTPIETGTNIINTKS